MSRRYSTGQEQLFQNLTRDLSDLVDNEELLHRSVGNFLNNLIDELTLGIIFDQHRKFKTDSYDLTVDMSEIAKEDQKIHYSGNRFNIVVCPICAKPLRIADNVRVHLAQCMKIPRPTTRSSNRQQRSDGREQSNSSYMHTYSDAHSENEGSEDGKDSDPDWSEKGKRNKGKKNKGTFSASGSKKYSPKKLTPKLDDEDALAHLNVLQLDDSNSNSTSPTLSTCSSHSETRKKKGNHKRKVGTLRQ